MKMSTKQKLKILRLVGDELSGMDEFLHSLEKKRKKTPMIKSAITRTTESRNELGEIQTIIMKSLYKKS